MLPLHPRIVHLPVALAMLMPLVTSGLLLAWWRGWLPRRAWAVAVALQLVLVVGGIVALRTGEADSRQAETVVAESLVDAHEDAGKLLTAGAFVVLLLTAGALALKSDGAARAVAALATVGTLAVLLLAWRAGHLGGQLVYVHGAARAYAPGAPPAAPAVHGEDD
jgi:uncharacterized membrane protein